MHALRGVLGEARLGSYIAKYQGRHDLAMRLYSWNVAVSAALWGPLGVVEVVFRNAVHEQLVARSGREDWWNDNRLQSQLLQRERRSIGEAVETARRRHSEASADDVIAASSFGLWVGLLDEGIPRDRLHSYETTLWQPRLHRAFPNYGGGRKQLHAELDAVRRIRNRVAHHEPIFDSQLAAIGDSIARIAGYVSPAAERYIRDSERFTETLGAKRSFVEEGTTHF